MRFGLAGEFYAHFAFHGRGQQALVAIFHRFRELPGERRGGFNGIVPRDACLRLLIGQGDANAQHLFVFSAVKRQYAVGNEFRDAFVKVVVELINAAGVLFRDFFGVRNSGCDRGMFEKQGAHAAAHAGIFSNDLCGDITRSCVGFQAGFHAFSCIQERARVFFEDGI